MLSPQNRPQRLASLEATLFDVAVIGGGITGAAVARDAAARGLSVALLEREDWAAGTSWRSTKLVHGGLRYLETGQVGLVFESLAERALLMQAAPHLVRPADFLLPAFSGRGRPRWQMAAGLTAYDLLSLGRAPSFHRRLSRTDLVRRERLLESPELLSGALYADGRTDDARLTLENVIDAASLGAAAVTGLQVEGLSCSRGSIDGISARDRESGQGMQIRARAVVNAAGPWGDRVRRMEDVAAPELLRLSRGAHLTVPASRLPLSEIVAFPFADGRLLFGVPQGAVTMLGTTDTDFAGSPDEVFAEPSDVAYLLAAARQTFPSAALSERDVVATFAGLRPLVRQPGRSLEETSREEAITVSEGGLVTVTGGKLTTHRRMAEKAIDRVARLLERQGVAVSACATRGRPFPGAPRGSFAREEEAATHLGRRYGRRAADVIALAAESVSFASPLVDGLPDIEAEIVFAARHEDARSLSDALVRRTHLFWQAPRQGLECAERAASLMARELGWGAASIARQLDAYAAEVDRSRRFRTPRGSPR
ncbi:MAG TPA: glycerol-3-phosphate dehydrogenase/oxidase [Thermoanaerobaculia bacterium]|nr:glycerol-3-phosphate dehydrogenase/oxidase [Thermoanaerobaculia bacterium]